MSDTEFKKLKLEKIIVSPNLVPELSKAHIEVIGREAVQGYDTDLLSRTDWEQRSEKGIKLALQVVESKSWPWKGCSNVKFPILTIAALQFLARVSVLTKGRLPARVEVIGRDPKGEKSQQARRLSEHLSYQLLHEDKNWRDSDEQAKLAAAILGCAFKKTYHDPVSGNVYSEHVPAMNFVVDYHCTDIDKARRITHLTYMSKNDLREREASGLFSKLEAEDLQGVSQDSLLKQASDEAQGLQRPEATSLPHEEVLEQHTWLDLDGDGYEEPYVIWVHRASRQVLRIVARFFDEGDVHRKNDGKIAALKVQAKDSPPELQAKYNAEIPKLEAASANPIVRIDPTLAFTRYLFLPSPDGGVYGLGLAALIGPTNESVNTLVNQLIDSGTVANTSGGFLGRGVKVKGGTTEFSPFEWKPVDSTGDDLRKNIFPLPVREPSAVLFQLLGLLIDYSERISGATDIMTGVSPGQNTPAETSRNTVEQGMMLFSGIYNRMYRGFSRELETRFALNKLYLAQSPQFADLTDGDNAILARDDYKANAFRVLPAASPEAVSASQQRDKAKLLLELAGTVPGFNRYEVTLNFLEAWNFDSVERFYPDPKGPNAVPPPINPKVELEKAKLQQGMQIHQDEMSLAVAELQAAAHLNEAKIAELQAKAIQHIAKAEGVETGNDVALLNAQIGAARAKQEGLLRAVELLHSQVEARKAAQIQTKPNQAGVKLHESK